MKQTLIRSTLILLLFISCVEQAFSADERMGVPSLEAKQRRQAIAAAPDGQDRSLPDEPMVVVKELTQPLDPEPSEIEKKLSDALDPVSLEEEIQLQTVQSRLELFGYDMFSGVATTFAPMTGAPVPEDYIIGPGDTFTVQAFSATDVQYTLTVTREGKILVPEVGALSVNGLTFEEAKKLIAESIEQQRIGIKTVVTLSELRSIQIMMVGEVVQPGTYTVSGFSTLINTLVSSGGIKRTGSLRNIQVKRNGVQVASLDLYDLLLKGDDGDNIHMRHGDLVFVPPIGSTVGIAGEVLRPAIYEINSENNVGEALRLAGGLLPTADKTQAQIERIADTGLYTLLQVDLFKQGQQINIQNGDLIRILPVLKKMEDVVLLSGHVLKPGGRQWRSGMRISDLIASPDILRQGAELDVAMVQRENRRTKRTEVVYFRLADVFTNYASIGNIRLEQRDQVIVFDTHSPRAEQLSTVSLKLKRQATSREPANLIEMKGFLRHPGTYPLEQGARLMDMIAYAGGLQGGVDLKYALLARTDLATERLEFVQINLHDALQFANGDHNPLLQPKDKIYLFDKQSNRAALLKQPVERLKRETQFGERAPVVHVTGAVFHPGAYPMVAGMRVKDLLLAAGGMKEEAYGIAATLSRQTILDGEYSQTDTLPVNLINDGPLAANRDSILHPNDHLVLRTKPEWIEKPVMVTVEGEIVYPGKYRMDKRDTLCSLIQQAGGFTDNAYLFGTVFLRESVRKKEQKALDRMIGELDQLLAEVHLSPGYEKDKKMPRDHNTRDIYEVIRRLESPKAQGRMVVDIANIVSHCDSQLDIVLEDGDRIIIPTHQEDVTVVGQVYFPASHRFDQERGALDYINLSGGLKELAQREHAYIVQANGEVLSIRSKASTWGGLFTPSNVIVTPGATIYVPISIDRINGRELASSWVDLFYKLALGAASIDFLFK
ncbi:MAG: hypothetical protein CMF25_07500 [Kangiellaceae bacterium]|nr:hypothetical protein [Kangiellaceae bacterium]